MKSLLGILLLVVLSVQNADAQHWFKTSSLEFGLMGGFSHYSGELTDDKFFETQGLKGSVGLITRYTPREAVTFRLSAHYGRLEGDDKWHEDQNDPLRRDLNFTSRLWDFTGAAEFNFNRIPQRQKSGVSPFLFAGVSVFKYNPVTIFNYDPSSAIANFPGINYASLESRDGEEVPLQPLGTEGQGTTEFNDIERYPLTQLAIPVGLGFKFKVSRKFTIGLEYGVRITFTDHLDDVSGNYVEPSRLQAQYGAISAALSVRSPTIDETTIEGTPRGDDSSNDLYGIFGLSFTFNFNEGKEGCPSFF